MKILSNNAFTLAETLITIGIIGAVAAIILPSLISNTKHKQYTARLKKFYSTMKQAQVYAEAEYGNVSGWDNSLPYKDYLNKYFSPYLKGEIVGSNRFQFNDGTYFSIFKGGCIDIIYDVNGYAKPNKAGYDQFRFLLCSAYCWNAGFCTYYSDYYVKKTKETEP